MYLLTNLKLRMMKMLYYSYYMIVKVHTFSINSGSLNTPQNECIFNYCYFLSSVGLDGCMIGNNSYIRDGHILRKVYFLLGS